MKINKILENYTTETSYDEMFSSEGKISEHWKPLISNIEKMGVTELMKSQNQINRIFSENGVTYNIYGNEGNTSRSWTLNPIPWIIDEKEWLQVEKGIKQRALLLDLIHKDIYGQKMLIKEKLLPYELVYAHRGFIPQIDNIYFKTSKNLLIYSVDMARGPDRRFWVISDRTQSPSGMGYALENRLTIAKAIPDLFEGLHVRKYFGFFNNFKKMLKESSPSKKDEPFIVVLTPGPFNETYFEHSYLASFLGYPLVQGNDLVTRDGYLWLKSLKGLTKVDVVIRRVDELYCDPLELKEDSYLGVAGFIEVIRKGNVTVINPIGIGVLENPGMIPFLPNISKKLLGEDLILPQIATWWCGQKKELKFVLDNLDRLIIKLIYQTNEQFTFIGSQLSKKELLQLRERILKNPHLFVGQEQVNFSTTPTFVDKNILPRKTIWRTFAVAGDNEYHVMPGGLIRSAVEKESFFVSNQSGGTSKDMWITCQNEDLQGRVSTIDENKGFFVTGLDSLPSQTGENLFWIGRYTARILITTRYIRTLVKSLADVYHVEKTMNRLSLNILFKGLTDLTITHPGFYSDDIDNVEKTIDELNSIIFDTSRVGSLSYSIDMLKNLNFTVRHLLSQDTWIVFDRFLQHWSNFAKNYTKNNNLLIRALDEIVLRIVAFMWLIEDNMYEEQGLVLYSIGLRLEESILISSKALTCLALKYSPDVEYELSEAILRSSESFNTYKLSYRSTLDIQKVIELLLIDPKYPKSLANKLEKLHNLVIKLPHLSNERGFTEYEKLIFSAYSSIKLKNSEELVMLDKEQNTRVNLKETLENVISLMMQTSDSISKTFFTHSYTVKNGNGQRLQL